MPKKNLKVTGAYSLHSSLSKNNQSEMDFSEDGEPKDLRTIWTCSLSVSAETKYEESADGILSVFKSSGVFYNYPQGSVSVNLIGEDGFDYKERQWTGDEIAEALSAAYDTAEKLIKQTYGTGI